jgi:hypothetical protein
MNKPLITAAFAALIIGAGVGVFAAHARSTSPTGSASDAEQLSTARAALDSITPAGWDSSTLTISVSSEATGAERGDIVVDDTDLGDFSQLRSTVAREWGRYLAGIHSTDGAPSGFPVSADDPVDTWAGCVAEILVVERRAEPPTGCSPDQRSFVASFLTAGPNS